MIVLHTRQRASSRLSIEPSAVTSYAALQLRQVTWSPGLRSRVSILHRLPIARGIHITRTPPRTVTARRLAVTVAAL